MIVRTAATFLSLTLLAAGAFAFAPGHSASEQALSFKPAAMSTIEKNQFWPIKGNITMESCTVNFCQEV